MVHELGTVFDSESGETSNGQSAATGSIENDG
jgi:hypothetical protein